MFVHVCLIIAVVSKAYSYENVSLLFVLQGDYFEFGNSI